MAKREFELSDNAEQLLSSLKELCNLPDEAAVLNSALTLLGWSAREMQKGCCIATVDEVGKRYRRLHLPALDNVQPIRLSRSESSGGACVDQNRSRKGAHDRASRRTACP